MKRHNLRVTILALNFAPETTGNAPYTTSLAQGLASAGHQVRVITGYPHYPAWRISEGYTGLSMTEEKGGVQLVRLRHFVPSKPNTLSRMCMELSFGVRLLFARWNRPDVVLLVSPALFSSAFGLVRARLQRDKPATCVWVQDLYGRGVVETGSGGDTLGRIMTAIESAILGSSDGVVAIHDRFQRYMVETLGLLPTQVRVIRNWTHLPSSPSVGCRELRARLGWTAEDVVVLHAGNMGKKQGLENVIAAARLAQETNSSVRFVLLGDGNQKKKLMSMSEGLDRIDFIAPLPGHDFMVALAAADALLVNELPGVKDMAVPSKLTSYFNAGVPVIAATDPDSVTANEVAISGGGVRVDAADPAALLKIAEELGRDKVRAKALGDNGLRFRHETLSEGTAIGHYDNFITSLASSRGR